MAIVISNTSSHINDTTLTYRLSFTGKTQPYVQGRIKVNGTLIGSANTSSSSYVDVTFTKAALYNAAKNYSPSGAVIFEVQELDIDYIPTGTTSQRTAGDVTINGRLSGFTWTSPTTANPIDLDQANPTNVGVSWSRPENNSAFYGRVKFYVWNGSSYVLIFSRYGFSTSISLDIPTYNYLDACIAAMGGVSPRKVKIEVISQFLFASYTDLSGISGSKEVTDGIVKSFYDGSKVGIHDGTSWVDHESYIYDGSTWKLAQVYVYNGTNWIESL